MQADPDTATEGTAPVLGSQRAGQHTEDTIPPPLGLDPNPGLRITALYGLYDILWTVALLATSPWWVLRCLFHRETRKMVLGRLTLDLPRLQVEPGRQRVLVHGVSVGEI